MLDVYHEISPPVILKALTDDAGADQQSRYVGLAGWDGVILEASVGVLTGVDGSNTLTPTLQEATASPSEAGSYSAVSSGEVIGGFSLIDDAAEDAVVQRACYIGDAPYVNVKLEYAGSGITAGFTEVRAYLFRAKKGPASSLTPVTGAVA